MKMKGISPLLAAVILVALVISIAFIISSAISSMAQKQTTAVAQQGTASGNVLQVTQVSCSPSGITFLLKNVGTQDITGLSVVAKDDAGNTASATVSGTFPKGGLNWVTASLSLSGTLNYLMVCSQAPSGICVERTTFAPTEDTDCTS